MADPKEPKRPVTPYTPDSPLPRLWKSEPDEEAEEEAKAARKAKKAASESPQPVPTRKPKKSALDKKKDSKKAKDKDGAAKGVLIEETPNLDTYETRQRIRIAIGVVLFVLFVAVGFVTVRIFSPAHRPDESNSQDLLTVTGTSGNPRERADQEARILFDRAQEAAKHGRTELALAILKKVSTAYPATPAAAEAKEALDRPRQNLPLFLDRPAVVASQVDKPPPATPDKPPDRVIDATRTTVASTVGAQAKLVQPVNPPEPSVAPTGAPPAPPSNVTPPAPETASRPLPKGFHPRPGVATHPSGWPPAIVGDRDGSPMVLVVGGAFIQGRDDADSAEGPAHQVVLGTYYIDQHEVTVRQFTLFQKEAGKRGERVRALAKDQATAGAEADEERPVVMVTAREASDYSNWAGKRLPTEAQWEAAARTPDGRIFPWGPEPPSWSKPRAYRQIDPVMSFPSDVSPYGAFDLAGNAWEWTKDWYDPKYYQQFRSTPADNPTGPLNRPRSQQLVVKGSSKDWRLSKRDGIKFDQRLPFLGFRCVLQVEGPGNAFEPPPAAVPAGGAGAPALGPGASVPF